MPNFFLLANRVIFTVSTLYLTVQEYGDNHKIGNFRSLEKS
jgi:hypothetical protein